MRDGHPLMAVQPHLFGKKQGEAVQDLERHPRLVLRGDADFDAQELVFAAAVVVVDQLHFLVNLLRRFAAQIMEGEKSRPSFPSRKMCSSALSPCAMALHFAIMIFNI